MTTTDVLTQSLKTIQGTTVTALLRLTNPFWVPSDRITDYATPLASILDEYNPSLFSTDQNRIIQNWMRASYGKIYNDAFVKPVHPTTNWQAYRIWVLAKIAVITRNADAILFLRDRLRYYLSFSIDSTTGTTEDFLQRDSLKYHCFTLCGMMQAVLVLRDGMTVVNPATGSITTRWDPDTVDYTRVFRPAWDLVQPFIDGRATHAEFIDSRIASDKSRSDYGKNFLLSDALPMLRLQNQLLNS